MQKLIFILFLLLCPTLLMAGYEETVEAYKSGNYQVALQGFHLLAKQDRLEAQFYLGVMYVNGYGVTKDYLQASEWFLKAANRGQPVAQHNLGLLYVNGEGVDKDYVQAYRWFHLAGEGGATRGTSNRDLVAKRMTTGQILEAQQLIREWKSQYSP